MAVVLGVATVVAAGISAYGSYQQGKAADAAAKYNAAIVENNAQRQARQSMLEAQQQAAVAKQQQAWLEYQAKVSENNALALKYQQKLVGQEAAENIRRQRRARRKQLADQRASQAAAGLNIGEGTVVENLAETSKVLELDIIELGRRAEIERRQLGLRAAGERAAAARSRSEAAFAGIAIANANAQNKMSKYIVQHGAERASIMRFEGAAARRAGTTAAVGTAIGGVGSAFGTTYTGTSAGVFGA